MDHFNEVFTVANSILSISTRAKDWPAVLHVIERVLETQS